MAERDADYTPQTLHGIPNEILLQIFSYLPFQAIIYARAVSRLWCLLIPQAIKPLYQTLLSKYLSSSIPIHLPEHLQVTIEQRKAFVNHVETSYDIHLPNEFRTILLEWPSRYPPPESQWPDSLCWYANKVCTRCLLGNEVCVCYHPELVGGYDITLTRSVFSSIMNNHAIPMSDNDSFAWELFNNPPRMSSEHSEQHTKRMIRSYADTMKQRTDSTLWVSLYIKCLPLCVYNTEEDGGEGWFCLVLVGKTKGEIHGWKSGWYDGWEADSFLEFHPTAMSVSTAIESIHSSS